MMAELMAGLQGADLPPEAAERLAQMGTTSPAASTVPTSDELPKQDDLTLLSPSAVAASIQSPVPAPALNEASSAIIEVTQVLAAKFNYEPSWLKPHLAIQSDLGLNQADIAQLRSQFGLATNGRQDWTISELAADIQQSRQSQVSPPNPVVSKPKSVTSPIPAKTGNEEWILIVGRATSSTSDLAHRIFSLLQNYRGVVLRLDMPGATQPFALTLDRNSKTLLEDIQVKLQQAAGQSSVDNSIWWGTEAQTAPASVGWLFPGSGSLYPGLLDELQTISPVVQKTLREAQAAFQENVGQELTFGSTTDPLWQRPATVTTSTAIAHLLQEFGVVPDIVSGHSVGELTACHWAGAFDLATLIHLTTAPFKGLNEYPKGSMLAVVGPEAQTLKLVQASQGRVIVSNRNSNQQLVVSGRQDDIRWFMEQSVRVGLNPIPLDVKTAYHSPLLTKAHQQYRQALQRVNFQIPQRPIISSLTGDLLPWSVLDFSQIRALLDCSFIAPVNFVAQLQRLRDLGTEILVDIGPTDRLAKLARETLGASGMTILGTNRTKRSSRLIFLEALAQLHTLGCELQIPAPVATPAAVTAQDAVASLERSLAVSTHNSQVATTSQMTLDVIGNRPTLIEPIAVIGMGGILPDANNIEEFWHNLLTGHDAIREIPQDTTFRWKQDLFYNPDPRVADKSYSKIGAFVPNFQFKPMEFRLTPKTVQQMDRGQKMALLATREAFRDSGYDDRPFDRQRVRVIIGTSLPEFHDLGAPRLFFDQIVDGFQQTELFQSLPESVQAQMIAQAREYVCRDIPTCSEDTMPGGLPNIVAGRVAFCFDLQGGNVILDAACAASLGALDYAIKSLRMGDIDMVVMGGADSAMSAGSYVAFCKTFALSAKGSYPFDSRADGFVMGEGCGILLLKRLGDAEQAGDQIHAVIRSCGSSSDGKGRGITAPSMDGQVLAMQRAYHDSGINPATIGFIEAHGTSTALGDSTEFASLANYFGKMPNPIYLGSVKSMVGHLKAAAGVAGLIKAILAAKHGKVPPTLNFESPNPQIDLANSPFKINTTTCDWTHTANTPRRVAVNSFGFGGTNFHVIVEAYDAEFYRSEQFRQELVQSRLYQDFYGSVTQDVALAPSPQLHARVESSTPAPAQGSTSRVESTSVELDSVTALQQLQQPLAVIHSATVTQPRLYPITQGIPQLKAEESLLGWISAVTPETLGAASFRHDHGVRYNYVAGAMAGGIGSADIVVSMAKAGMMGFFGSGGVPLERVEKVLQEIRDRLTDTPNAAYGFNLLHNPIEFGVEDQTVDLYLKYGVRKVSASAYLRLMPSVVRYRATGMKRLPNGQIQAPNSVFAKVSSLDVAAQFMAPPPAAMLKLLVEQGKLTSEEAELAAQLPVAQDITAEADSGGHTDRRPLSVLLPQMLRLRDEVAAKHGYSQHGIALRVGAAGSMGDPMSIRAALAMGADYILTGSINQTSTQAGTSQRAKEMLSQATMNDVVMAPAADMFEMGVQVQVLKRGSFYPQRGRKLYEIYKTYDSFAAIPADERLKLERDIFRQSLDEVWASTQDYWQKRDPKQVEKALKDGKHQMALAFRAYLGLSSRWAQMGQEDRKSDYQIWCGPAIGLFNRWVAGTWLESLENRDVALMGLALLHGAATLTRTEQLLANGLSLPPVSDLIKPVSRESLLQMLPGYSAIGATV
jgi:PfaD family protein